MRRLRWTLVGCILAAVCLAQAPLARGEDASWVGKTIVLTKRGVKIGQMGDDGKVHEDATLDNLVYDVEEEKGDWIRVSQDGVAGWLLRRHAILLDQAAAYFTDSVARDDKDDFAYGARGCVAIWNDEDDAGCADLSQAIRLNPADAVWRRKRGDYWYNKEEYDKALADLNEALRLDPTCPAALVTRGWSWIGAGENQKAMADFDKAVELAPKWADAYAQRGYGRYFTLKSNVNAAPAPDRLKEVIERTVADYNEAIRLDPAAVNAFEWRALAWITVEQFDKAIDDYSAAIRVRPADAELLYKRARAWLFKLEIENARDDLDEAVRLNPRNAGLFVARGVVRFMLDAYDMAIADFDEAIRLDPRMALAFSNRAAAWSAKGEEDKAMADLNEAIRIDPKCASAFAGRGIAWWAKNEYRKALADFDEAIRLNPEEPSTLNARASFLATCQDEKIRNGKQAVADAEHACALLGWENTNHLATLAAAYAEAGEFDEAVKWQNQVVDHWTKINEPVEDAKKRLDLYKAHKPYHGAYSASTGEGGHITFPP